MPEVLTNSFPGSPVGEPRDRVDGRAKVTGRATYAAEAPVRNLTHAMIVQSAIARGEIRQKKLAHYPQIVVAPAIVAVIWQSLFARHSPLDASEMLRVHLDLIFGERSAT